MTGLARARVRETHLVSQAGLRTLDIAIPTALAALAAVLGLLAAALVRFPHNEGSAYYMTVAQNLVTGRGLVVDALWSYVTPPLTLPRPAFELWQPLASLMAAAPMALLGASFQAGQLAGVMAGAVLAPIGWAIAREAAAALGVPPPRRAFLATGSGLLVAVTGPLLIAQAVPDSTLPFAVFGTLACWLLPRAASGRPAATVAFGVALGVAYLCRHEAIWIAATFLAFTLVTRRFEPRRLAAVAVGALALVGPWLLRNVATFGSPWPGQALDNALLTYNEQIFAYHDQPTIDGFLAQGAATIVGNMAAGLAHNLVEVLLVSAVPVGAVGLAGTVVLLRRPALRRTSLGALLVAGWLIFAATGLLFPVATRWGTFQHAAGPLLVGLAIASVLAGDRLVGWIGRQRGWQNANAWLAPLALAVVAAVVAALQVLIVAGQAEASRARVDAMAQVVATQPEIAAGERPLLLTDRPLWLSAATGLPAAALPREPAESALALAEELAGGNVLIVLSDEQADPRRLAGAAATCLVERTLPSTAPAGMVMLAVAAECRP